MTIKAALLGMASLATASFSSWHAGLLHARAEAPSQPASLFSADPEVAVTQAEARIGGSPLQIPIMAAGIEANARKALANNPLNAPAMRQLGLAAAARTGSEAGGLAQFRAAEGITRRDAGTQFQLINAAAKVDDLPGALAHYNRVLLVRVDGPDLLMPGLARGLSVPAIREALAPYASAIWFPQLLGNGLRFGADPAALIELLAAASPHLTKAEAGAQWIRLIGQLADANHFAEAGLAISRAPAGTGQAVGRFEVSVATLNRNLGKLAWRIPATEGVQSGLAADGGLAVQMDSERQAILAERVTLLAPGAYAIAQELRHEGGMAQVAIGWQAHCLSADGSPGDLLLDAPAVANGGALLVTVPQGCAAQQWRISGRAEQTQSAAQVTIFRLSLRKLPQYQ